MKDGFVGVVAKMWRRIGSLAKNVEIITQNNLLKQDSIALKKKVIELTNDIVITTPAVGGITF